jgi:hypothetical protein
MNSLAALTADQEVRAISARTIHSQYLAGRSPAARARYDTTGSHSCSFPSCNSTTQVAKRSIT